MCFESRDAVSTWGCMQKAWSVFGLWIMARGLIWKTHLVFLGIHPQSAKAGGFREFLHNWFMVMRIYGYMGARLRISRGCFWGFLSVCNHLGSLHQLHHPSRMQGHWDRGFLAFWGSCPQSLVTPSCSKHFCSSKMRCVANPDFFPAPSFSPFRKEGLHLSG